MKVEIIIPTCNRRHYLRSLLNDLVHQTYQSFTVWVCSDGPDMKVFEMINDYNNNYNPSFNYLHTPQVSNDWGITPRKLCVDQLQDDTVACFIDDDNSISAKYLETLVTPFLENPKAEVTIGQIYLADLEINGERVIPNCPLVKNYCYAYGYIDPLCMMIKSKIVKDHIRFWGITRDSDYNFMQSVIISYSPIFIQKIIGVHR